MRKALTIAAVAAGTALLARGLRRGASLRGRVVLITALKVHPFLALILGSGLLGVVAGLGIDKTIDSFTNGVGSTVGSYGCGLLSGSTAMSASRRRRSGCWRRWSRTTAGSTC